MTLAENAQESVWMKVMHLIVKRRLQNNKMGNIAFYL